jgi:hypothetical protein
MRFMNPPFSFPRRINRGVRDCQYRRNCQKVRIEKQKLTAEAQRRGENKEHLPQIHGQPGQVCADNHGLRNKA